MSQQQNALLINSERSKDVMKIIKSSLTIDTNDLILKFLNIESYVNNIDKNCGQISNLFLEYIDDIWWETCNNSMHSAGNQIKPVFEMNENKFELKDLEMEITPDVILEELMNLMINDDE